MKVSIIMPTYNKLPRLKLTLISFKKALTDENIELIIVNDGSDDGTKEYLEHACISPNCKVINTERQGRALARNTAVTWAEGDLLLFCDDDVLVTENYVQEHIAAHGQENNLMVHNRIMSLEYLRYFMNPSTGEPYSDYMNYEFHRLKSKCITGEDILYQFDDKIVKQAKRLYMNVIIEYIFNNHLENKFGWLASTGTCVSVMRKKFDEIGGFSSCFGLNWGGEDFDLGYRFGESGGKFKYIRNLESYHIAHYREDSILLLKEMFQKFYGQYYDPDIIKASRVVTREEQLTYLLQP